MSDHDLLVLSKQFNLTVSSSLSTICKYSKCMYMDQCRNLQLFHAQYFLPVAQTIKTFKYYIFYSQIMCSVPRIEKHCHEYYNINLLIAPAITFGASKFSVLQQIFWYQYFHDIFLLSTTKTPKIYMKHSWQWKYAMKI